MGMMSLHLHVNKKSDYDTIIEYINADISNGGIWSKLQFCSRKGHAQVSLTSNKKRKLNSAVI